MVSIVLLLAACLAAFVVDTTAQTITLQLTIRDNGKICSPWTPMGGVGSSLSYSYQRECISAVALEGKTGAVRLCCQGMPLTTPSTNFPKECGRQHYQPLKQRIVGGMQATANSWPWQVLLRGVNSQCGGSLIDRQHVLTAAHCFNFPVLASDYKVTVGLHDQARPAYMEQEIVAKNVWTHEQYNSSIFQNDIAVIRLSTPVEVSDTVNFICLPGEEVGRAVNQTVWVSGWGKTAFSGSASAVLKQTWLHTLGDKCKIYGQAAFNEEKQLCAGRHTKDSDTCQGDSGGPLMLESNGRWFLNGVVSYGSACGEQGHPSVYARVSYYLPWIRSKMALA